MLFNLSLKNFRKSIRDYSIYFFTMILGVAVFYIFNAIETQTAMMEVTPGESRHYPYDERGSVRGKCFRISGSGVSDRLCQQIYAEKAEKGIWSLSYPGYGADQTGGYAVAGDHLDGTDLSGSRTAGGDRPFPAYVPGSFQSVSGGCIQI